MQCQKTQLNYGTAVRATTLECVWLLRMDAPQHLTVGTIFAVGALCRHSFGLTRNDFCYNPASVRPGSSVGRAADWKSACHWFDSSPGHHIQGVANHNVLRISIARTSHVLRHTLCQILWYFLPKYTPTFVLRDTHHFLTRNSEWLWTAVFACSL